MCDLMLSCSLKAATESVWRTRPTSLFKYAKAQDRKHGGIRHSEQTTHKEEAADDANVRANVSHAAV